MPAVVACGAHHTTAISRKGELYSWGLGCNGELGLGRWGPIELSAPRQCSSPSVRPCLTRPAALCHSALGRRRKRRCAPLLAGCTD